LPKLKLATLTKICFILRKYQISTRTCCFNSRWIAKDC